MAKRVWMPTSKPKKVEYPDQAQVARYLLSQVGVTRDMGGKFKSQFKQAIGVNHHNANTGFSHRSSGFRFRRYGA